VGGVNTTAGVRLQDAILTAAIATFVQNGYDNTSMDEVAARASTTKRTVYAHFGNKEGLFRAALTAAVARFQAEMPALVDVSEPAAELEAFAKGFCELCTWRGAVQLQRVVMSGAEHFADLGGLLHREIIERAELVVAGYLALLAGRGDADSHRPLASVFLNMTTGAARFATLLQARDPLPEHPARARSGQGVDQSGVRLAVDVFLHGSGLAGARTGRRV
jgi:AcrR family transcriptional regulator